MVSTEIGRAERRSLQLQLALEAGRLGVWEWDRPTDRVAWSSELEGLAGLAAGAFGGTVAAYLDAVHPDDRDDVGAAIEQGIVDGHLLVEHRFVHPDGTVRWVECRGAVRVDDDGEVVGMVGVTIDVTDRVRRRRRLEAREPILLALNRISLQLNREHDRHRLAETIVEVTAHACGVDGAALLSRTSVVHSWEVAARHGSFDLDPEAVAAEVARGLAASASIERTGVLPVAGALVVPVIAMHDLTDLLVVPVPATGADEVSQLLAGIGAHAATALENARLHALTAAELAARNVALAERDEVARQLQQSLLPPALPEIAGIDIASGYLPLTEGIGGDFYDVYPLAGGAWGVVLGDVCGKGPAAAGVTALARHTIRAAAMAGNPPTESVTILNRAMTERDQDERTFCTLVDARLTPGDGHVRIVAGVAGHPPLLVLRADGTLEAVGPTGHLVGMFDEIAVGATTVELGRGDLCVLYTDGATDVRRGREVFGDERLRDVVRSCRSMSAAAVVRSIEVAVVDFQDGEISDDLAIVALRVPEL